MQNRAEFVILFEELQCASEGGNGVVKRLKRALCLALAALLLAVSAPTGADAAEIVCFLAANEKLFPLSDDTMPFWSDGSWYVPHTMLDGGELGIHYSRNMEKLLFTAYSLSSGSITFDLAAGTIETNTLRVIPGSALVRGGLVFLPLGVLCDFFSLDYIYTRVAYGYLLRVKNKSDTFSDERFIDAATSSMAQRLAQYERAHAPAGSASSAPESGERPQAPAQRTVYLAVESTASEHTLPLLETALPGRVAFLFAPPSLSDSGDLLRQLAARGGTIALRVDASAGAAEALEQIERCNRALWEAAAVKTRVVALDGASEETARAVEDAGYCPLRFTLDYRAELPSVSRASSRIFSAADASRGVCRVFLGTDEAVSGSLSALLTSLRAGNCTLSPLNEATL